MRPGGAHRQGRLIALATPDDAAPPGGRRRRHRDRDRGAVRRHGPGRPAVRAPRAPGRAATPDAHVDDGGTATPDAVDAINSRGGEVVYAREIRATFDDVFATLVARDQATRAAVGGAEATADGADEGATKADAMTAADRRTQPRGRGMRAPATMLLRLLALVGKEIVEVLRRPGALISLVLGPFLIMAVFGLGYNGVRRPLETVVVIPPDSGLSTDVAEYQALAGGGLHISAVVPDEAAAEPGLADGSTDVVVVAPADAQAQFKAGKQSIIEVVRSIRSTRSGPTTRASWPATSPTPSTRRSSARPRPKARTWPSQAGQPDAAKIPPDVVAAPTKAELSNIAPSEPQVLAYFGPAVLALILQHLAVTLVALALVRERTSGVIELFRVAPVNAWEVMAGKVVAYLLIGGLIAVATVALLVGVFGIPMLGDPGVLAAAIGLVLLASLGIGLVIAVVSDSERQAVQLSLLLLLASVFFSGFVLAISEFTEPIRVLAYMLPVTHGIQLMQDIMLRGSVTQRWEFAALGRSPW